MDIIRVFGVLTKVGREQRAPEVPSRVLTSEPAHSAPVTPRSVDVDGNTSRTTPEKGADGFHSGGTSFWQRHCQQILNRREIRGILSLLGRQQPPTAAAHGHVHVGPGGPPAAHTGLLRRGHSDEAGEVPRRGTTAPRKPRGPLANK